MTTSQALPTRAPALTAWLRHSTAAAALLGASLAAAPAPAQDLVASAPPAAAEPGTHWRPQASERLVRLSPEYLKRRIDHDFAGSGLGQALRQNGERIAHKGNTLADLQAAIERADGELRIELRHQFLAEKRAYLQLMSDQIEMRRREAETRLSLYDDMLGALSRDKAAMTPDRQALVDKQMEARQRMASTLSTVDLQVFASPGVPESRYATKYAENMGAIEQLVNRMREHDMNRSVTADGEELTKEEFIRRMASKAQGDLALLDQEVTILGYMAKLIALDAMELSERATDPELSDAALSTDSGPAEAVNFFLRN